MLLVHRVCFLLSKGEKQPIKARKYCYYKDQKFGIKVNDKEMMTVLALLGSSKLKGLLYDTFRF